ncbi:LEAF RUST 10 DISEASE-RESISTANCE LOCUS RECEPTOR-LIKE PROTEIN KINASE-like 1.2 isoform X1 [Iris pallida]|uniref:non-specific serine/threonine protein kinase n=1 Tax=Iris pallida TaxID=29817 RepID=A0AAX6DNP7_IRIPA|nr:LEAF RUST 10 DISEASE-RESISTANCE LOCUS RECEPTOR-LIKE PROTEIN KINASE-like 1.2 isoform X1 [Iris pallida]
MAVFFSRPSTVLLLLLFFFITTTEICSPFSCPIHPSCDSSIDIHYPFYTEDNVLGCNRTYLIRCINASKAMIEIEGHLLHVKDINYDEKTITVEDGQFTTDHPNLACSFLYNFTHPPILHFDGPNYSSIIDNIPISDDCKWGEDSFAPLSRRYSYSVCRDFSFHYCTESEKDPSDQWVSPRCQAQKPRVFELKLSFSAPDGVGMSLLSAGFSYTLKLYPDCFNATVCSNTETKKEKHTNAIIGASVGGAVALIACGFLFWYKRRKRLQRSVLSNLLTQSTSSKFSSMNDPELAESNYRTHIFSYEELQEATNGFDASRELGDGGFGTVYKGKLRDGRTVAVKRLYENNYRRLEQFMNEVDILSRLRHQNLVTLYGCTSRRSRELLLVYEFVASGTVADHLHGAHASSGPLLWQDRMSIAIETADALAYLHAVEPPIVHRDVKSTNILLDDNFHVKVADFGLSRLFPLDATHVSTAPQGTPGYVDPEYHQCYQLTDKSDVYSFGVVLVELISSKPAVDISRSRHEINLANMAVNMIQKCQLDQLVDPALGYDTDLEVKRMVTQVAELAFTCLQPDRDLRPSIKEVLEELKAIKNYGGRDDAAAEVRVQLAQTCKEETRALKDASPFSPDSVADRWQSTSTTPSNSGG